MIDFSNNVEHVPGWQTNSRMPSPVPLLSRHRQEREAMRLYHAHCPRHLHGTRVSLRTFVGSSLQNHRSCLQSKLWIWHFFFSFVLKTYLSQLRYQKCLDAHPQGLGRSQSSIQTPGKSLGATLKSIVGSLTGRKGRVTESWDEAQSLQVSRCCNHIIKGRLVV